MLVPSLVGRSRETLALQDVLDQAARGGSRLALIEGQAGMGKSRLLQELQASAAESGFAVHTWKAEELERDRPFGAIAGALELRPESPDPAARAIGIQLEQEVAPGGPQRDRPPELRFGILDGIVQLVEGLAADRPLLLALDDLHWADPSTLLTLHRLARLPAAAIAVLGAYRPVPRVPELDLVVQAGLERGGAHVVLAPLVAEDVGTLASELLGATPGPLLLGQLGGAGGNPFFLHELLQALEREGLIERRNGLAEVSSAILPPPLRLTILRRIAYLPDQTLHALRIATVLGSSFSVTDLATVLDRSPGDLMPLLDEALRAGVIADAPPRLAFQHDLVREAIYRDLPEGLRAALHLQAGRALAAAGGLPGQVATHLAMGAPPGDPEAISWLRRAAADAFPKAPPVAAEFLQRAVALLPEDAPEHDALRAELVHALLWSGRLTEAETLGREVLEAGPHDLASRGALHNGLARALVWQGRPADSLAQIEAALGEPGVGDRDRAYLLAELALRLLHCRDLPASDEAADAALALARATGHAIAECDALCARCWSALLAGRIPQAVSFGERAVALALADPAARVVDPWTYQAEALIAADRLDDASEVLDAAARALQELGTAYKQPVVEAWRTLLGFLKGEWQEAQAAAQAALALADEVGMRAFTIWVWAVLAHIAVRQGRLEEAEHAIQAGEREIAPYNLSRFGLPWLLWARALLEEARGEAGSALSLLEGTWQWMTALDCLWECQHLAPHLVRMAIGSGRDQLAEKVTRTVEELSARARTSSSRATALRCRGLLARDPELLVEAVALLDRTPLVFDAAAAREEAGLALVKTGYRDRAVPMLVEAARAYQEVGAARDLGRIESTLRELGVRRGVRGTRGRPSAGWDSLTEMERQVARLAAQGLTNPEIGERLYISRRTVATHISHVLAKLSLSSRVELATAWTRAETDDHPATGSSA